MRGDATSEVNTAGRQHLERKIAGLIAENRNKNVECGGAQSAGVGRIEAELDDGLRRVASSLMSDWEGCIIATIGPPDPSTEFLNCPPEFHPHICIWWTPL